MAQKMRSRSIQPHTSTCPSKENPPVYASNHYVIYEATASDAVKLWYLSQITGQPRLRDRALIGDIQGAPAAAISLADNRIVADPSRDTARLTQQLRSRAQSVRALEGAGTSCPTRDGLT